MAGERFGGLSVDAVVWELFEGVESCAVEVEKCAARCCRCEEAGEACGGAGFEVGVWSRREGGEAAEGDPHFD